MSVSLKTAVASLFFFLITVLSSITVSAQSIGDYRSVASGNWTNASVWQYYDGTNWVAATTYPGQLPGTNDVFIQGGYSVSIYSNIPDTINSLTIGDGSGATDNFYIANASSLQTQLITIADGGLVEWTSNTDFTIPAGAAFKIESGGELATDNPCSAAKRLIIGSTRYSTCNGGSGVDYSFDDLNDSGGTLAVSPTSNSPICENDVLNLYSNPSGAGSSSATYNWSATGPSGYSFSSSDENPIILELSSGSYTYTVTISDGNISYTESIAVTVNPLPLITTQPQEQNITAGNNATFTINTIGADTFQWEVSTNGGSSFTSITDGAEYSGTQSATLTVTTPNSNKNGYIFRVQVSNSTSACGDVTSNGANLNIVIGTVVTNRRITYRVNND